MRFQDKFSEIETCLPKDDIGSLKEFSQKVYQVHSGKQLKDRIDITDSRKIYEATITVAKNGVYENLLSDNAKAARDAGAGTMKIKFERKSNVRYAVSGGALYSFAKKPVIDMIKNDSYLDINNYYIYISKYSYTPVSPSIMIFLKNPLIQLLISSNSSNKWQIITNEINYSSYSSYSSYFPFSCRRQRPWLMKKRLK